MRAKFPIFAGASCALLFALISADVSFGQIAEPAPASSNAAAAADANDIPDDQLRQNAEIYARETGVAPAEAQRRLRQIRAALRLRERLEASERGNFAGLSIDHGQQFRIRVRFRNNPAESLRRYANLFGLADATDVVSETATVSINELQTAATQLRSALDAADIDYVLEPDERQGRLLIAVTSSAPLDAAIASGRVVLPAFVTRQVRTQLFEPTAYIVGGSRVRAVSPSGNPSGCTLSFAVRDAANVRGLTSAGHCDDATVRADGISPATPNIVLSAGLGQRLTNGYDFQWHSFASTHIASPSIDGGSSDDDAYRHVAGENRSAAISLDGEDIVIVDRSDSEEATAIVCQGDSAVFDCCLHEPAARRAHDIHH